MAKTATTTAAAAVQSSVLSAVSAVAVTGDYGPRL